MAVSHLGILVTSLALVGAAVLIYLLAVTGLLFARATPPTDLGLYSITVVLLGFGVAGLLLRRAKMKEEAASTFP